MYVKSAHADKNFRTKYNEIVVMCIFVCYNDSN